MIAFFLVLVILAGVIGSVAFLRAGSPYMQAEGTPLFAEDFDIIEQ